MKQNNEVKTSDLLTLNTTFLPPAEVAPLLHTTEHKLRNDRHLKRGLPYYKLGRKVLYSQDDIETYLTENRISH